MSSSEQAPEPTMDEILASIRKIISDDEPGDSPQTESVAPDAAPPAEGALVDDLANALDDTQAGAEAADDILDLTTVVSEQAPAEARQGMDPQIDALQAALGDAMETPASQMPEAREEIVAPQVSPAPNPQDATFGEQAGGGVDISAVLAEAGIEETVSAVSAGPAPAAEASGDIDASPPEPASAGAATITDALSAVKPLTADPVPEAAQDAEMTVTPDAPANEPAPEVLTEASIDTGVYNPEAEEEGANVPGDEPAGTGAGSPAGDLTAESAFEPAAEPGVMQADAPPETTPAVTAPLEDAEPVEEASSVEEPETVEAAAPVSDAGEGRTLEDSVKDMLRPMLREWLDENMERIVQKEVSAGNLKGSDG